MNGSQFQQSAGERMKNKKTPVLFIIIALLIWACGLNYPEETPKVSYPQAQLVKRVLSYNELRNEMHCELVVNYDSSFTELSLVVEALGFEEDTFFLVLNDAGLQGDALANDGIYSRNAVLNRIDSIDGRLAVKYELYNDTKLIKTAFDTLELFANLPPVILEIMMPDTIIRPASGTKDLFISLKVDDPNGVHDVISAYFQVKNNTTKLWSSDFPMNDAGEAGDLLAGDGIFSSGLQISSKNTAATNYFRFRVKDTAANFSEWALDSVVVR